MAKDKAAGTGGTVLIVTISVLLIAALMGWLFMQERNRETATVAQGDSAAPAAPGAPAGAAPSQVVTSSEFEPNLKSYVDQVIELTDAKFQAGLSPQTFWLELPSGAPFLVKLDEALVAAGTTPPAGGTLDIVGTVKQKDAALVAQWVTAGVLQNQDQALQAEFGTTYLEANAIRPAGQ